MNLQWELLYNDSASFPRLLQFEQSGSERFSYGINEKTQHCLYFFYPTDNDNWPVESILLSNIQLDEANINNKSALILTLLNNRLNSLFSDLIISLVTQTILIESGRQKVRFISLCNEWFELFDPLTGQLTRQNLQGLFAEVHFLKHLLLGTKVPFNEVLEAWKGPFNKGHDFEFVVKHFEVKSCTESRPLLHISSEYQLDYLDGQHLSLAVCGFSSIGSEGVPLSSIINETASILRTQTGIRMNLFWSALSKAGITVNNIEEYNHELFTVKYLRYFNCNHPEFPSIRRSLINDSLRNIKYELVLADLAAFEIYDLPLLI